MRAAGLWEYSFGEMAMERGTTPEMKEAGEHLVVGHAGLDELCRKTAPDPADDTVLDPITVLEKTGLVNHDQVNHQQTNPPKLPQEQVTAPVPQPGAPMVVLTPRPALNVRTSAPTATPTVPPAE